MHTKDLLIEYGNTWNEYSDKKAELDVLIQQWLDNDIKINSSEIQKIIDNTNNELDELKSLCDTYLNEYKKIVAEESRKKHAIYSLKQSFGVSPESMIITGGVIGKNTNESHLFGRIKTNQEIALEKQNLLNELKRKVISKEISLSDASTMKQKIDLAYTSANTIEEQASKKR